MDNLKKMREWMNSVRSTCLKMLIWGIETLYKRQKHAGSCGIHLALLHPCRYHARGEPVLFVRKSLDGVKLKADLHQGRLVQG